MIAAVFAGELLAVVHAHTYRRVIEQQDAAYATAMRAQGVTLDRSRWTQAERALLRWLR